MALQNYFVVYEKNGEFFFDFDIAINLHNGDIWDTEEEKWKQSYEEELIHQYEEAYWKLSKIINAANEEKEKVNGTNNL